MFCIHCFQWQQYNQTIEIVKQWMAFNMVKLWMKNFKTISFRLQSKLQINK